MVGPRTRSLRVRLVGAPPVRPGGRPLDLSGVRGAPLIRVTWYVACDVPGCTSWQNLIDRAGQAPAEGVGRYLIDRALHAGWIMTRDAHVCPSHNPAFMAGAVEC